ncbi:hypothetical protein [Ammoniphilus sp. YIM 78166]|uniref:hypothetical protein n=1 Tax=Ammoniphilus sp. YIM 78166 TaxID=1644106 RepID=UPI00106F0AC8|nr:hypothetical protein [Ammoniphilus sp. YIM 78166]
MNSSEKVAVFHKLSELVNLYSESRDLPINEGANNSFFEEVERYCAILDLDYSTFKKTFGLMDWRDMWNK